jgi:hypothetical protein
MSKITVVDGLEMYATRRDYTFDINYHVDGIEVLLLRNGEPRRMALCTHVNDAETILDALRFSKEKGEIDI